MAGTEVKRIQPRECFSINLHGVPALILSLIIIAGVMPAQARVFTPTGESRGLEAQVVSKVMVDSQGFLWVASREGLYRYDGFESQAFLPDPGNSDSISDVDIRFVYEDHEGIIWVGTQTSGLDRLDPVTGKFTNFRHDPTDSASISDDHIFSISEGPDGGLWLATLKGLCRLDRESFLFENFRHDPSAGTSLSDDQVLTLHLSENSRLWAGTADGGVSLWNPASRSFSNFDLAALTGGPEKRNQVLALYEDDSSQLWAGTAEGLVRLNRESGQAEVIELGKEEGFSPVITTILPEGPDRLWLSTLARGLLIFSRDSGDWSPVSTIPAGTAGALPSDALKSIAFGPGMVFAGTWGSGVYRAPIEATQFRLLNMQNANGLGNNVISAVMAGDEDGRPWVGTLGGGPRNVNVMENAVGAMPLKRHGMRASGVMSLAGPIDGRLYAATTHGLYEFSVDGFQVALYAHDPQDSAGIGAGHVTSLLPANGLGLWVGMGGSGLHYFDTATQQFTAYRHQPDQPASLSGDFVTALLDDGKSHIWVGTRSNGLNRCDIRNWSCQRFEGSQGLPDDLSHQHVTAIYRDRRGRVWVGTDGGGLNQVTIDEKGGISGFRHWGREHGLLTDGILAIQEDLDESLWLSTRNGLSRFNPASGDVYNHVAASGLPVSHFNSNASAADQQFIYFGSTDGLISIPKGSLLGKRDPVAVKIVSVEHAENGKLRQAVAGSGHKLRLPYEEVISVELAVLDFAESKNEYAYRLHPGDPWLDLGPQRQIIFHQLAPGHYDLQARGRDAFGLWNESETFSLEIIPPFWMTPWFRGLLVLLLLGMAGAAHLARQAVLKRRANELLRLGVARERALEEQLGSEAELAVLTPRQKEILQLIAEGNSTREIAELLGVSIKTVEAHRANLMERLDIRDVPGLVRLAIRTRLIELKD